MRVAFEKLEGLGNDFVLIDGRVIGARRPSPALAQRLCHRRRGVGADGLIWIAPSEDADIAMRILNADGSRAEMCGNGLRCVLRWFAALNASRAGSQIWVDTEAGRLWGRVASGEVTALTGFPRLIGERTVAGARGIEWEVGNPHFVTQGHGDLTALATRRGPLLQAAFPEGINVGVVKRTGADALSLVVYERGAGLTEACGTGAVAAAASARHWGWLEAGHAATVHLPGGSLKIRFESEDAGLSAIITGPACHVFSGEVEIADDEWTAA